MIRVRRPFILTGHVPPSKSWLNRALILKSLHPDLRIVEWQPSELDGDDVVHLSAALQALAKGEKEFNIGESGTGLRFLLARLACENGTFTVRGTKRLLDRPHEVLIQALGELGTTVVKLDVETFQVTSHGWPEGDVRVEIDASESSQFASALLLAASRSQNKFDLVLTGESRSLGYLEMTRSMVSSVILGRKVLVAEPDASSVATLAMVAVAASHESLRRTKKRLASESFEVEAADAAKRLAALRALVEKTRQPDRVVFEYLDLMNTRDTEADELCAIQIDIGGAPDLFPCLAALAAFAKGTSRFEGAPHLRLKESDRIAGLARLLKTVGIGHRELADGLEVDGVTPEQKENFAHLRRQGLAYTFDPESDHRLAFAAAVLAAGGVPIEVTKRGVVAKSLPMFWTMIEGDAPRVALIGNHRAGKTEAAKRWAHELGPRVTAIDLDREVERLAGRSVTEILEKQGEVEFRWFEKQAWREIDAETRNSIGAAVVSCGADFDVSILDDSWVKVELRRVGDYARERKAPYIADRTFEFAEGLRDPSERAWVNDLFDADSSEEGGPSSIALIGGAVTLLPHHNISETFERLLRWGVGRVEIRDDLWPPSTCARAWDFFAELPLEKMIISLRADGETDETLEHIERWLATRDLAVDKLAIDWPLERGETMPVKLSSWMRDNRVRLIASQHGSANQVTPDDLIRHETRLKTQFGLSITVKAALETSDFATLAKFHAWMSASTATRVFLPMTPMGPMNRTSPGVARSTPRWQWYRAWLGIRAPHGLNFWREDDGSSLDQPTFSQWWRRRRFLSEDFAAVLGDPVLHSRTPLEHDAFFRARRCPVFAITMTRAEVATGLPLLISMGLKAAAVTAPLKEEIVKGKAVNTIAVVDGKIETTSTDDVGFKRLWQEATELCRVLGIQTDDVVVWGGGGVLRSVAETLPNAIYFSASKGEPREAARGEPREAARGEPREAASGGATLAGHFDRAQGPSVVVWAAGDARGAWPASWRPHMVVDLSYLDDSMGRAIAHEVGALYVSGLSMFEAQAAAQREFWASKG